MYTSDFTELGVAYPYAGTSINTKLAVVAYPANRDQRDSSVVEFTNPGSGTSEHSELAKFAYPADRDRCDVAKPIVANSDSGAAEHSKFTELAAASAVSVGLGRKGRELA